MAFLIIFLGSGHGNFLNYQSSKQDGLYNFQIYAVILLDVFQLGYKTVLSAGPLCQVKEVLHIPLPSSYTQKYLGSTSELCPEFIALEVTSAVCVDHQRCNINVFVRAGSVCRDCSNILGNLDPSLWIYPLPPSLIRNIILCFFLVSFALLRHGWGELYAFQQSPGARDVFVHHTGLSWMVHCSTAHPLCPHPLNTSLVPPASYGAFQNGQLPAYSFSSKLRAVMNNNMFSLKITWTAF